jgi:Tol biopolymer transport system component
MRPNFRAKCFTAAAVASAAAVCLLTASGPASAVVPGSNGVIATYGCGNLPNCTINHIWTVDPETGAEHQVTSGPDADYYPSFSPDGSRIVFARCPAVQGQKCRIALVDVGGGSVTYPTPGTDSEDTPTFSPDGTKIAFVRNDPSSGVNLIVMDADGGNEHPLTSGSALDRRPTWSPDGSSVTFQRQQGASQGIYTVPASGGSPTPLTVGPDEGPSYSPDGSRITFGRFDPQVGSASIWTMSGGGGDQHALTTNPAGAWDWKPAYSPDGSKIAFTHAPQGEGGPGPLWVMDADGANPHPITPATENHYAPAWQPLHQAAAGDGSGSGGSTSGAGTLTGASAARCSTLLAGTAKGDELLGTSGGDLINGLAGNDVIKGGAGDDCLNGRKGRDRISGGAGSDVLSGGPGNDVLAGGKGRNKVYGGAGDDTLNIADGRKDIASCGRGRDKVRADKGDTLRGCERVTRVKG